MNSHYYTGPAYEVVNQPIVQRNPWQPGIWRRLPWAAILGLLTAILGMGASVVILYESNGKPITDWSFQPTVYLAIVTAITNILLSLTLTRATTIAWWRRAQSSDTNIADLHRTWKYGHSFKAAILSGRFVNLVAVACVLTSLAPINGPLLQRASKVVVVERVAPVQLQSRLSDSVFLNGTGISSGRITKVQMFTPEFRDTVLGWNNNRTIPSGDTGCKGVCRTNVQGIGLALNCSSYTVPYSLEPDVMDNGTFILDNKTLIGTQTFYTSFSFSAFSDLDLGTGPATFNLSVQYKDLPDETGQLQVKNCSMHPVIVEYPVIINGNASTIALDPNTTIFDDTLLRPYTGAKVGDVPSYPGPSTFGGIGLALSTRYQSTANMRFVGAVGYEIVVTGNTACQYVQLPNIQFDLVGGNPGTTWTDPTADILAGARELMFRLSVGAVNSSTPAQSVTGQETQILAVYQSNYAYLAGALVLTAAAIVSVTIILNGYWLAGRDTTMSPIETAKAFGAPIFAGVDGNATAGEIVAAVGAKKVRYGAVGDHKAFGKYGERISVASLDVARDMRLVIAEDESVIKPRKGWIFLG